MCVPRPVGTRGGVRWMRGPGACPRWGATILPHGTPTNRRATRTSTRPPPCPTSAPCPYRTGTRAFPSLVVQNQQDGAAPLPHSVVNIHQERGRHIPGFGCQHSSGGGGISSPFPIRLLKFSRSITARRTHGCAQCICHPVLQTGRASSILLAKPFPSLVMKKCTAPSSSGL